VDLLKFWTLPKILKELKIRKEAMEHFGAAFMSVGIVTLAGRVGYIPMLHNRMISLTMH